MAAENGVVLAGMGAEKVDALEKTKSQPAQERAHDGYSGRSSYDDDLSDDLADLDEDCFIGDATLVEGKQSKKPESILEPPALPQKSRLRASRLLENLKLSSIETATQSLATSHDMYLSSEEDASSSADEFSDYDWDSSSEVSEGPTHRRRTSYEDTARIVSVIYSGKPCIVDLPSLRHSPSTCSADTASENASFHTASGSSTSLDSTSLETPPPPRSSSLAQPSFLNDDPFASNGYSLESTNDERLDGTPRRGPAVFNRVSKTLSLVKKRSRPFLRTSNLSSMSRENISYPLSASTLDLSYLESPRLEQTPTFESPRDQTTMSMSPLRRPALVRAARQDAASRTNSIITLPATISPIAAPSITKRSLLSSLKSSKRRSLKS